ncbi:A2 inhibitor and Ly6 PLAUR domain-containing protein-like [Podarcis lilfordi]|uniref:A2 inhibitor and Ly6 PLAUR domain-containing protein-like n=1 Tax=Podarcis lilfordi TaxID=74358 RepID=A0AA35KP89_9SAUR|nr:A2 inhibitor and Ly6 PLAUR domain-containing protein-like [Podarcis lilfordi]
MQALLGLLFFSLLLATGASLQCEICTATGQTCSSDNVECDPQLDTCAVVQYEPTPPSVNVSKIVKECLVKTDCEKKKIGESVLGLGKIKTFECNKAPGAAASLLLAFSSLLLMKSLL